MSKEAPFVVTISRQLGSGGSYLGQRLARRLGALYADRDILRAAARRLGTSEDLLDARDEQLTSFWQSLLQSYSAGVPELAYAPPIVNLPTDGDIYAAEAEVISQIAQEHDAVIVGRGGFYVLRDHPHHVSIFLHADQEFRSRRVQELYRISAEEAQVLIESTDRARARYHEVLTGTNWYDARQYHLSLDTSRIGFEAAEAALIQLLRSVAGSFFPSL